MIKRFVQNLQVIKIVAEITTESDCYWVTSFASFSLIGLNVNFR